MDLEPSPKQALILWKLLFTGEEPAQSKVKPELKPKEREPLVAAGLIEKQKRGRSTHLVLTDKAWEWAVDHFDAEVMKSMYAGPVLRALLTKLKLYLAQSGVSLAELLEPALTSDAIPGGDAVGRDAPPSRNETASDPPAPQPTAATPRPPATGDPEGLRQRARKVCLELGGMHTNQRIRVVDLRRALPEADRAELDATLLDMEQRGELVLLTLDNPAERTPADEAAALTVLGEKRHILYLAR